MAAPVQAREDRERQIVAATRRLFDERGMQEAAIDGIARAVGINKALIYRHFASKEELFVLTLTSYLAEIREGSAALDHTADPLTRLREACQSFAAYCLEHPAFLDCATSLMRGPAPDLRERVSEAVWFRLGRAMAECLETLASPLRAGKEAGVFPIEDPDYVANRIYVQVIGTMHLARIGVGVRAFAPGIPQIFEIDPARVRRECAQDALALALTPRPA